MRRRRFLGIALGATSIAGAAASAGIAWDRLTLKRFAVVEPGRIYRTAWPRATPLVRLIRAEDIRTVVTLTALNRDDPKYVEHEHAIRQTDARWTIVPMRGSTATIAQMADAADLVADPANQPVLFHCVGGHHRSNLVHAAYLMRHKRMTAEKAWSVVSHLSWSRPTLDAADYQRICEFGLVYGSHGSEVGGFDVARAVGLLP